MTRPTRAWARVAVAGVGAGAAVLFGLHWGWAAALGVFVWALLASGWTLRVGLGVSGAALAYFLHGIDLLEIWQTVSRIQWGWLVPAVGAGFGLYAVKAYRWQILLEPVKKLGFWRLFRASLMGFMVNCVLPARIGEFVRAGAVAMRGDVRVMPVFATILVERVFDLFGVIFYFAACVILLWPMLTRPEISGMMNFVWIGGGVFTAAFLVAVVTLALLKRFPQRILSLSDRVVRFVLGVILAVACLLVKPTPKRWRDRILEGLEGVGEAVDRKSIHILGGFVEGLRVLKGMVQVAWLCFLTLVHWGFAILIDYFVALCFKDLDMTLLGATLVFVFTALAVALPSAPGFVGVFQVATDAACRALAIPAGAVAKSYAMVLWLMVNLPVLIGGLICLAFEGVSFTELRKHGERAREEDEEAAEGAAT